MTRPADELDEIVEEFLVESHENLDRLDQQLVALEQQPDADTLASIFRTIHTIKGTSGFLGYGVLEQVTHAGEHLLAKLRDGELAVTAELTSALLRLVDAVRQLLGDIERTGREGTDDFADLVATLQRLDRGDPPPAPVEAPIAGSAEPDTQLAGSTEPAGPAPSGPSVSDSSIRVDVGLLDNLMNLVGELVLARNQILQFTHALDDTDAGLAATSQRLNLITTELQEGVMKTRMQPIEHAWAKFPRVVRDLAVACGKQVRIELEGRETELDKTIIEAIRDPLTHLVRNAVDHGIEPPDRRVERGKPAEGVVRLRAFHEGGQVNIEISDDGAGLSPARIRAKAVERELITAEQAAQLGARELAGLIFLPGFSTADHVSNISGRGVGMDVVKTNIEAIGGSIDVQSREGEGTLFRIKIPLTLAIIPALLVTSGGERYAIPQVSLLELVRVDRRDAAGAVEHVHGTPVHRLRGRLLPLVFLDEVLGTTGTGAEEPDVVNIVVLQADGEQFGLVVADISDTAEIVVKPLSRLLKGVEAFAGATIMGDGRIALILDVLGLADMAGIGRHREQALGAEADDVAPEDTRTLLLVSLGGRRLALELAQVARLEELDPAAIERAGVREVVQYRDEILPLVFLGDELAYDADRADDAPLRVVVCTQDGRSVGLVVDAIHDIVDEAVVIDPALAVPGTVGAAVIQGQVTDVVDVDAVLRHAAGGRQAVAA